MNIKISNSIWVMDKGLNLEMSACNPCKTNFAGRSRVVSRLGALSVGFVAVFSRIRSFSALALLGLYFFTFGPQLSAQNQIMKGSIQGQITDGQGQFIPGVDLRLVHLTRDQSWNLVSDQEGRYVHHGLEPGRYRIQANMPGFQEYISRDLMLHIGENLRLNIQLVVAGSAERVTVTSNRSERRSHYSSPANLITLEEIQNTNTVTVEDVVNYQPSLVVRRRFIGDTNGTLGMRGANMFQTTRSVVLADGVPLHNPLQTRWNGAPKWSLVTPDEVESVEVIYGPFSAEHSGNAMGGVVKMNTRLPQQREMKVGGNFFSQPFQFRGNDSIFNGYRFFSSYGDRIGKFSFQVFHNHLENSSQPQNFNRDDRLASTTLERPRVSGAFETLTERGVSAILYGDTGPEEVRSDLVKFKGGYEFSSGFFTQLTLAYEDRGHVRDDGNNYLRDSNGITVWGDGDDQTADAVFNGVPLNVRNALFGVGEASRENLFVGWEVDGTLGQNWTFNTILSRFSILEDTSIESNFNPQDPRDDRSGTITAFDDSGWSTFEVKFHNHRFLDRLNLNFLGGYHYSAQQIRIDQFSSLDVRRKSRDQLNNASGGKTNIQAFFAQLGWSFFPDWEMTLGGRQEFWKSRDGFFQDRSLSLLQPERDIAKFSPKFSLGWEPAGRLRLQYSLGVANRFPVPEELFDFEFRTFGTVLGDATLNPEAGIHQNLSFQYGIEDGHLELNLFRDDVDDTIFTQFQFIGGAPLFSFLPIDEVRTMGLEIVLDQRRLLGSKLDLQVNTTFLDSVITKHSLDPSVEGNQFPRMPNVRLGLLAVYHLSGSWEASLGARFSSNQFDDLDNLDRVDNVFGAIDDFFFLDAKLNYRLESGGILSVGVQNLTNQKAFVFHPWPQRTFFMEVSLDALNTLFR